MKFFDKVFGQISAIFGPSQAESRAEKQPEKAVELTITITGYGATTSYVSEEEVAERVATYEYVLANELPRPGPAEQWWNDETQRRRNRQGSDKFYTWLSPFVPIDIAKLDELEVSDIVSLGDARVTFNLRKLIRERKKNKGPHEELLRALYGYALLSDLVDSLRFEQVINLGGFVDIKEIRALKVDFHSMGYRAIRSLSKTDVKWLVESFGEPISHNSVASQWAHINQHAVCRWCWSELRASNESSRSLGLPEKTMSEWLASIVRMNLGYRKDSEDRAMLREAKKADAEAEREAAWRATRSTFVVADLETTGLDPDTCEIIELAALQVSPDGHILAVLSTLVRPSRPIPPAITRLTGITQEAVDGGGVASERAIRELMEFAGSGAIFFHNAPFDLQFLDKAAQLAGMKFTSSVCDTLPLTQQAWRSLPTYRLSALAQHVGAPAPAHRALEDAKATLAVLLAARQAVQPAP